MLRKREDFAISLRKQNKFEKLQSKRSKLTTKMKSSYAPRTSNGPTGNYDNNFLVKHPALANIDESFCVSINFYHLVRKIN